MMPRYVVINEIDRDDFERKWQIPYGYGECEVHLDLEDAINELETYYSSSDWIVEEVTDDGRQVVYRGGLQEA